MITITFAGCLLSKRADLLNGTLTRDLNTLNFGSFCSYLFYRYVIVG